MTIFLLQELIPWGQIVQFGPTVVLLTLILLFLIRVAPTYKEIKVKELEVRGLESHSKSEQAASLSQLASSLKEIAVEQRRATETVQILQRVNADSTDRLTVSVERLAERVQQQEENCGECRGRLERLETNATQGNSSK
ncbi:MAG: hypothetical protein MSG64_07425 [Pyrinomonadaceae bacterium MAG19_C2-C3]|nr:hypothetical protein [Pyrinomonadaceae bacterium MAG19_C2-C3]